MNWKPSWQPSDTAWSEDAASPGTRPSPFCPGACLPTVPCGCWHQGTPEGQCGAALRLHLASPHAHWHPKSGRGHAAGCWCVSSAPSWHAQTGPQLCSKIRVGSGSWERPGSGSRHLWACRVGSRSKERPGSESRHFQAFGGRRAFPGLPTVQRCLGPQPWLGWLQLHPGGWGYDLPPAPKSTGMPRLTAAVWEAAAAPRRVGLLPALWRAEPQSHLPTAARNFAAASPDGLLLPSLSLLLGFHLILCLDGACILYCILFIACFLMYFLHTNLQLLEGKKCLKKFSHQLTVIHYLLGLLNV